MLNTKIAIGIAAVLLVTGGYFAINANKNSPKENGAENKTENKVEEKTEAKTDGKKIPFSEFIKNGDSYKCTVHQLVGGTDTVGTTYINKGMVKGEYNTKVQGLSITSNVIVRDGYTYSWSSMTPTTGFKAKVVADTKTNTQTGMSGSYSYNAEQIGDYSCESWTANPTIFDLPAGVIFKEI